MSTTKKTPAKKTAAKKSSKKIVVSKEQLVAILKRLESGQSGLIAEATKLGFNGSKPLHKALTELLGGKEKYNAMLRRAVKARSGKNQNGKKAPVKKAAKKTPAKKAEPVAKKTPAAEPVTVVEPAQAAA
jgi:hypothetical protein